MASSCLRASWCGRWALPAGWLCAAWLCAACGSDSSDDDGVSGAGTGGSGAGGSGMGQAGAGAGGVAAGELPYAPCPADSYVGGFVIELGNGFTSVDGQVFDAVDPRAIPTELASEGDCRLLSLPNLLCDPACPATTQTCGANNQCVPLPVAHSVGTVAVSGLARAVEMTANANTASYRPAPPALPHPGFAPGADLRLSASGGDYQPFELRGWGIEPLQFTGDTLDVSGGMPANLSWVPPTQAGPARVHAVLNINNHGSSNTSIECDFADTGAASIPASLIDALIERGASGFPTLTIIRRTASSTSIEPGCVQLSVSTDIMNSIDVTLPGLVSCNEDNPCPEGQTCRALERYCE